MKTKKEPFLNATSPIAEKMLAFSIDITFEIDSARFSTHQAESKFFDEPTPSPLPSSCAKCDPAKSAEIMI